MSDINQNKNAEDILTDDSLIEKMGDWESRDGDIQDKELELARLIWQTTKDGKAVFDPGEKDRIDERIINSINSSKRNARRVWIGSVAASMLLLLGLTFFLQQSNSSAIKDFALSASTNSNSVNTCLMLSGEKKIQIDSREARIEYGNNGRDVVINTQQKESQSLVASGTAFNTVVVPYGKRARIILSDSTSVWLNSGSKLVYPVTFRNEKREVYLDGEAMFEVKHDRNHPFYVLTRDLDVKVLGTVFNLCAYSDDNTVNTILESGSVELSYRYNFILGSSKEKMIPGMLAVYDPEKNSIEQSEVNTKNYTSWKDGYVILEKGTLGSIIKKLSRYYNMSIELDDQELAGDTFSGYLDLRNSATQVLEIIAEIVDIEFVQSANQIKISRKKV